MSTATDQVIAKQLRNLVTKMNKRLRKQANSMEQFSVAESSVLSCLMITGDMAPSELGAELHISSQFMSQVLKRLESLGLLARKASRTDGRKTIVSLTKKGRDKIETSRSQREEWLADIIATQYSAEQKAVIQRALELLTRMTEL